MGPLSGPGEIDRPRSFAIDAASDLFACGYDFELTALRTATGRTDVTERAGFAVVQHFQSSLFGPDETQSITSVYDIPKLTRKNTSANVISMEPNCMSSEAAEE